jgi:hypothetical protein
VNHALLCALCNDLGRGRRCLHIVAVPEGFTHFVLLINVKNASHTHTLITHLHQWAYTLRMRVLCRSQNAVQCLWRALDEGRSSMQQVLRKKEEEGRITRSEEATSKAQGTVG